MDLGSKEVLMESPPVSVIMCVYTCGCMYMVGPAASNRFPHQIHVLNQARTVLS